MNNQILIHILTFFYDKYIYCMIQVLEGGWFFSSQSLDGHLILKVKPLGI